MNQYSKKLILLTYNPGSTFKDVLESVIHQNCLDKKEVLIIDSSSTDGTPELVRTFGIDLIIIPKSEFGHGKTRKIASEIVGNVDIIIFMTQDAVLYNNQSIGNLCDYFYKDKMISAVYGRQIPYINTNLFGTHARLFNYPDKSYIRGIGDKEKYGIKTAFFSDTFGAYKKRVLDELGSFPDVSTNEDTYMAAKMLLHGYKIGYCAEAKVYHSHSFSILEEYNRYREIGKFYKNESWLIETFGKAEGEGVRFLKSQIKLIVGRNKWYLLPELFIRNLVKYIGYKLG